MEDLRDRLNTLLDYWVEHNREHEEEMSQWATKAASLEPQVAEALRSAAASLARATVSLQDAQEALRRAGGGPSSA